ncbi:SWIM zinc finger family protein [Vibrio salinus]|uniref:SWIM zinc finger family protein n=1 Tax=Vibrio salinus TaxID=2899784 RepID=UPI001E29DBB3|nr:SWIM zinc finger domain-containing protein [Vibrio salinus]MCE0495932.1 SWIM zinc finger domain-containing protein [Vibrio salinus]
MMAKKGMAKNPLEIDVAALQAMSDPKVYDKGVALAKRGAVRNMKISGDTVTAVVDGSGSNAYPVQLNVGQHFSAFCACPAAGFQTICKHAIALTLTACGTITPEKPTAEESAETGDPEREMIKAYLSGLAPQARMEMLLDYLYMDEVQWKTLLTKIRLSERHLSLREMKSLITQALPRKSLWNWRQVRDYFIKAEEQLTAVFESLEVMTPDQQWKLVCYAVERLNKVLEQIDDSNGERFGIEALINRKMPVIFGQLDWSDSKKAQWMFERMSSFEFDVFPSIKDDFADVWRSNSHFLQLCREAIALPSSQRDWWVTNQYAKPLIEVATDWQEVMAIKEKIAHRCRDYLDLCREYIDHQQPLKVEFWLAKARKEGGEKEKTRCDKIQVDLLLLQGDKDRAWQLANWMFQQRPNFEGYLELAELKAIHQIEDDDFWERVEQQLIGCYQPPQNGRVRHGSDAIVQFYLARNELEKLCHWADSHQISYDMLSEVADRVLESQPEKALNYTMRTASVIIGQGKKPAYQQALQVLRKFEAKLQQQAPQTLAGFYQQVNTLAKENQRKRTMYQLLKTCYADHL